MESQSDMNIKSYTDEQNDTLGEETMQAGVSGPK